MRTVEEEDVANYATTNEGGGKRGKCQIVLPQRPTSDLRLVSALDVVQWKAG